MGSSVPPKNHFGPPLELPSPLQLFFGPPLASQGSFGAPSELPNPSKSNRCSCRLFFKEILEIRHDFQANRSRGLIKLKIPLQLYHRFAFTVSNRPRGVTKHTFDKPNRSRGSTKQKIPLQLYVHFDVKTTFKPQNHSNRSSCMLKSHFAPFICLRRPVTPLGSYGKTARASTNSCYTALPHALAHTHQFIFLAKASLASPKLGQPSLAQP